MAGTIQIRGSAKEITPELRNLVVDTLCSLHDKGRYEDVALVLNKLDLSFSNARAIISMTNARPGTYEYHCATNAKMAMCFAEMGAVAVPTPPQKMAMCFAEMGAVAVPTPPQTARCQL